MILAHKITRDEPPKNLRYLVIIFEVDKGASVKYQYCGFLGKQPQHMISQFFDGKETPMGDYIVQLPRVFNTRDEAEGAIEVNNRMNSWAGDYAYEIVPIDIG